MAHNVAREFKRLVGGDERKLTSADREDPLSRQVPNARSLARDDERLASEPHVVGSRFEKDGVEIADFDMAVVDQVSELVAREDHVLSPAQAECGDSKSAGARLSTRLPIAPPSVAARISWRPSRSGSSRLLNHRHKADYLGTLKTARRY